MGASSTPSTSVPGTAPSTTRAPRPKSPFAVGTAVETLTEPATATAAARTITTYLRYPAASGTPGVESPGAPPELAGGPYPLIVFSQGFDIAASRYAAMLDTWTEAGYVVAEPVYPGTDPAGPGPLDRADIVNHPGDLSFVITQLLQQNASSSSVLSNLIEPWNVIAAGQSDGGDVSLAAVANTCCRDARIRAAILLSGAEYVAFGTAYFTTPSVPLLIVQGTADVINPPVCSNQIFDAASGPKYYVVLQGADHLVAYTTTGTYAQVVDKVTLDFMAGVTGSGKASFARIGVDGNVAGVASTVAPGTEMPLDGVCPGAPASASG